MNDRFGLKTFIDSCIWGHSNQLLKDLDNIYSILKENSYDYTKSNRAAGHVHMILSTALTMMIDNAECFMFLHTPNSINLSDEIALTQSPWIYSEITISKLIRKHARRKSVILEKADKTFAKGGEVLEIEYKLGLDHLLEINWQDVRNPWISRARVIPKKHPLDILFELANE